MGTLFWIVLFCFIYISLGDDDPTPPPGYEGWTPPRGYEGTTRGYEGWTTTPGYEGSTTSQSEYSTTGRYQSEDSTVGHRPNPESDKHNYQHEKGRSPFNEGNNSVLEFDFTSRESDPLLDPGRFLNITPPDPPTEYPSFITGPVKSLHGKLFNDVFNFIINKGLFFNSEEEKSQAPWEYQAPEDLKKLIDFELGENGVSHEELMKQIELTVKYSPHTSHPFYMTKEGGGLDPYGVIGELLTSSLSSVLLTFYSAPVFSLMELEVTKKLRELIGYPEPGDGVTTPGPSFANIMAVQLALHNLNGQVKLSGIIAVGSPKYKIFISENGCPSFEKAAILQGLGSQAVVKVKSGFGKGLGRMDADYLKEEIEKAINASEVPLMIVATAGNLITGGVDPINEIADVAEKYGIWLHIDGTIGGPLLWSTNHRDKLHGVNRSDSFTWSSSFMFGVPASSSFILSKHEFILRDTFSYEASYVFATSILYNHSYDLGDHTIQTCRRPDVLKSWLLWKAKGARGLQNHVDCVMRLKDEFTSLMNFYEPGGPRQKFYGPTSWSDTPLVQFTYFPNAWGGYEYEFKHKAKEFHGRLRHELSANGIVELSVHDDSEYFTISLTNCALRKEDLVYILDRIEFYGERILTPEELDEIKEKLKIGHELDGIEKSITEAKSRVPISRNAPETRSGLLPPPLTFESTVNVPIKELHRSLFVYIFQHLIDRGIFFQKKRHDPAKRFRIPEELIKIIDINFSGNFEPLTENGLIEEVNKIIDFSAHQAHPFWIYQLFTGLNPYTLIGDWVVGIANTGMESYQSSPVYSIAELEILQNVRKLIGYPNEGKDGDGVVNPGGTLSNIMGITVARFKKAPEVKEHGVAAVMKKLVLYVSIDAHYSFNKGAFLLGLGLDNCVLIKTDESGRMLVSDLRKKVEKTIAKGKIPFMVAATAGTTVLGAIDPLEEVGQICKEFGMWFHVDGVFGGAILFSETQRKKLKGIEMSDSLTFNPHKMFGATMTCSVFVTRHTGIIKQALNVTHLTEANNNELQGATQAYDRGDGHILGGRRANGYKFWLLWKAQGTIGLGQHIDYVFENTKYAIELMKEQSDKFYLIQPEFDLTNICFVYIPIKYRLLDPTTHYFAKYIGPITRRLSIILTQNGVMDIVVQGTESKPEVPTFFKFVLMSSTTNKADIKYLLEQIDFYGKDL